MRDTYSLYEAKARLFAIIRRVREGHRIVVTVHGEPAAEIHPIAAESPDLGARLAELVERGVIIPAGHPVKPLGPIARKPGALKRFLDDRGE
jgi:prevent-host-death family protein